MNVYPGLMVLYRQREPRAGQLDLAAMVTRVRSPDRVDLNIYPPMAEFYQQPNVPMLSDVFKANCWLMPESAAPMNVEALAKDVLAVDEAVLAPLINRIASFELRLDAIEAKRGPGRPRKEEAA